MIAALVALLGGLALGFIVGRPVEKRERCGAWGSQEEMNNTTGRYHTVDHRCKERVDPRCLAGYCTVHCRHPQRCDGACIKAYAAKLAAQPEPKKLPEWKGD